LNKTGLKLHLLVMSETGKENREPVSVSKAEGGVALVERGQGEGAIDGQTDD
jgi:hypothetical protein